MLRKALQAGKKRLIHFSVISCILFASLINISTGSDDLSSDLFGMGGTGRLNNEIIEKMNLSNPDDWNSKGLGIIEDVYASTSSATFAQGISKNKEEESSSFAAIQGNAAIALSNISDTYSSRTENINYIVKEGDTASSIAYSFGISTNTILWANNLGERDYIQPDDELVILPVSGMQYKVKANDSVEKIAKKYHADAEKIIAFNGIPADGAIKKDQDLIIPGGKIIVPKPQRRVLASSTSSVSKAFIPSSGKSVTTYKGARHSFCPGHCTWYVGSRYNIPWSGHAKSWLANARTYGFATGSQPQIGSIVVTTESWWGHVGIVEKVYTDKIVISEMNHLGRYKKSVRVLSRSSRLVRGYIY